MTFAARADALSWGRTKRVPQRVAAPRHVYDLPSVIAAAPGGSVLPVGLMRSYGDSVLNSAGGLIDMTGLARVLHFDAGGGTLRAEAGASLDQLMRLIVPAGWFFAVTPGTRFVTLGGAIANDVHGKNHHRAGTFGRHVLRLGLLRSDGRREVGPDDTTGLFAATVGGLGLTGIIEWAEVRLQRIASAWIDGELVPFRSLGEFWNLAQESTLDWEHTVAWIDCTAGAGQGARGIFSRGNWSARGDLSAHVAGPRLDVPMQVPVNLLNRATVGLFNRAYYTAQRRKAGPFRQHYARFFHPLDGVANWNRLYGRKGFWQYQCAIPPAAMREAVAALLDGIAASGQGSFLAVLKTFGDVASPGMLSFPMHGATLALDFPNRGAATLDLFARLDAIVEEAGGRLYAAKDGRVTREMWEAGYPALGRFAPLVDPAFASDFWRRVAPCALATAGAVATLAEAK